MIYFAHRGISGNFPQNSILAFKKAKEVGAQYYELDVHLTSDGQLVVYHDYSLLPILGISKEIKDFTLSELIQLAKEKNLSIFPSLEEVLRCILPSAKLVNIELKNDDNKYPNLVANLLQLLHQPFFAEFTHKILFSSFDKSTLQEIREKFSNARIGVLMRQYDLPSALTLKPESIHLSFKKFTPKIAQECHKHHLCCYLYTVNDTLTATELESRGTDGIFTDHVDLFLQSTQKTNSHHCSQ